MGRYYENLCKILEQVYTDLLGHYVRKYVSSSTNVIVVVASAKPENEYDDDELC